MVGAPYSGSGRIANPWPLLRRRRVRTLKGEHPYYYEKWSGAKQRQATAQAKQEKAIKTYQSIAQSQPKETQSRHPLPAERRDISQELEAARQEAEAARREAEAARQEAEAAARAVAQREIERAPTPAPPVVREPPPKPSLGYELRVDGVSMGFFSSPEALARAAARIVQPGQQYEILRDGVLISRKTVDKPSEKGGGFPWILIPIAAVAAYAAS